MDPFVAAMVWEQRDANQRRHSAPVMKTLANMESAPNVLLVKSEMTPRKLVSGAPLERCVALMVKELPAVNQPQLSALQVRLVNTESAQTVPPEKFQTTGNNARIPRMSNRRQAAFQYIE